METILIELRRYGRDLCPVQQANVVQIHGSTPAQETAATAGRNDFLGENLSMEVGEMITTVMITTANFHAFSVMKHCEEFGTDVFPACNTRCMCLSD